MDPEPSGGEELLPAGPSACLWAPVSAPVSLAAALPGHSQWKKYCELKEEKQKV